MSTMLQNSMRVSERKLLLTALSMLVTMLFSSSSPSSSFASAQFTPTPDTPVPTVVETRTGSTFIIVLVVMICVVVIALVLALLACVYVKGKQDDQVADRTILIRSKSNNSSINNNSNQQNNHSSNSQNNSSFQQQHLQQQHQDRPNLIISNHQHDIDPVLAEEGTEMRQIPPQQGQGGQQQQQQQQRVLPPPSPTSSTSATATKGTAGDSFMSANGISLGGVNSLANRPSNHTPTSATGGGNNFLTANSNAGGGGGAGGNAQQQQKLATSVGGNGSITGADRSATSILENTINFNENDASDNERRRMISSGQYQKMKMIGRGAFGSVYSVLLVTGQSIAVKEMNLDVDDEAVYHEALAAVDKEMEVMQTIDHPNVVRYYSAELDKPNNLVRVFMELITGGSLGSMARSMKSPLSEKVVQRFMFQAVSGLAYVHGKGIVHRDLKGDNILLSTTGAVKLADFGTARQVGGNTRGAQTMLGTPYFMAPELLVERDTGEIGYGVKADVWSMGITVAELLNCGKPPWPEFSNPGQAFIHIANDDSFPIIPDHCTEQCKEFILFACQRDPSQRPSSSELLQHPWLSSLDSMDGSQFNRSERRGSNNPKT